MSEIVSGPRSRCDENSNENFDWGSGASVFIAREDCKYWRGTDEDRTIFHEMKLL
jgi:hypothetical protein